MRRPMNAFMLFYTENRARMQAEHGTTDATSLSAIVGRVWKEMPQGEKQVYFDRSKQVGVFGVEGLGVRLRGPGERGGCGRKWLKRRSKSILIGLNGYVCLG